MSKITRALQKIFGGSLSPSNNIAQFGSLAAGSPAYSSDPAVIQALAKYLQGWASATVGNTSPALEDRNALDYLFSYQLAYLGQAGISEWIATQTYYIGSWCQVAGVAYISKTDGNINHPVSDTNNWQSLSDYIASQIINPSTISRAWVVFNGYDATITSGFNVASIDMLDTGNYMVNFGSSLLNADYTYSLSGCQDDAHTTRSSQMTRLSGDTKTATQLQVRNIDTFLGFGVSSRELCVSVFANP